MATLSRSNFTRKNYVLFSSPMEEKSTPVRCINLDWLEVHVREPLTKPHDSMYFRSCGYVVHEREYGTRVYREMFVIDGKDGKPLVEVRRNPASTGLNGIHDPNECHIRLVNRACYFDNAADWFERFLAYHGYYDVRISRVDICLDFATFDYGDDPAAFVRRYFHRRYSKINQGRIHAHGNDTWSGQDWNSLSWGSKSSCVSTKLYNKTLELYDPKFNVFAKPYIRTAWLQCGLIDDWEHVTKNGELVNVWRVEFSLTSAVKKWVPIVLNGKEKDFQSLRNTLDTYRDRPRILMMFASLAQHYFRFKYFEEGIRKDRCKDKKLFDFSGVQQFYKVGRDDYAPVDNMKEVKRWSRLLTLLEQYQSYAFELDAKKACGILIEALKEDNLRGAAINPWSRKEITELRALLTVRLNHPEFTYDEAMDIVREYLGINDKTLKFD